MNNNYKIEVLSKKICESNIDKILDILKLIPNKEGIVMEIEKK